MVKTKINILWLSRHDMTTAQEIDLRRIYGDISIIKHDKTISDVKELLKFNDIKVFAVVLPADIIAKLKEIIVDDIEVIQPVSGRVKTGKTIINPATGKEESEYVFEHLYWQKVKKAIFETERL